MVRRWKYLAGIVVALMLVAGNLEIASAHRWGSWHWHKGGTQIVIQNSNVAHNWWAAEYARQDGWNKIGILYNYRNSNHTDISVFDGHVWNQTWAGLASIESTAWNWGTWSYTHITHTHARYNRRYGDSNQAFIQGVFCQEIGHGWGLEHSNTGDCMGAGYHNNIYYYGPHNVSDFYSLYRYH